MEKVIKEIKETGSINSKWYEQTFPNIASSKPCNFNSIGGVLEVLGYAQYNEKKYIKL